MTNKRPPSETLINFDTHVYNLPVNSILGMPADFLRRTILEALNLSWAFLSGPYGAYRESLEKDDYAFLRVEPLFSFDEGEMTSHLDGIFFEDIDLETLQDLKDEDIGQMLVDGILNLHVDYLRFDPQAVFQRLVLISSGVSLKKEKLFFSADTNTLGRGVGLRDAKVTCGYVDDAGEFLSMGREKEAYLQNAFACLMMGAESLFYFLVKEFLFMQEGPLGAILLMGCTPTLGKKSWASVGQHVHAILKAYNKSRNK